MFHGTFTNFTAYNDNVRIISKLRLSLLSPKKILENSVCEITDPQPRNSDGTIKSNGLLDTRMGVIDPDLRCATCHLSNMHCGGHYGHIVLAKPVIPIDKYAYISKILNCVCFTCSTLLLNKEDENLMTEIKMRKESGRLNYLYKYVKQKTPLCPNCGTQNLSFTKVNNQENIMRIQGVLRTKNDKKTIIFNAEDCLTILSKISDEDIDLLGMDAVVSRPEWLIWTVMLIPPPAMRPSVKIDGVSEQEDDLTHKLVDIVRVNCRLRDCLQKQNADPNAVIEYRQGEAKTNITKYIEECWQFLQYHIVTYIDNTITSNNLPKATNKLKRPLKTLKDRWNKSKEGRVRGNTMGKRVDHSARSVITCDPSLSIDQVGVPLEIAMNMTFPEVVNEFNIDRLYACVRNGTGKYPGAKRYINSGQANTIDRFVKYLDNEDVRNKIVLHYGDVVHRHLMDDDIVIMNRQPSLHKMSLMCHRVKVFSTSSTFRTDVKIMKPYNGDYDGDEMNMYVLRTLETVTEGQILMATPTQLITPQSNKPLVGLVQDSLTGIYRFTKFAKQLSQEDVMRLLSVIDDNIVEIPHKDKSLAQYWTAQEIISLVLPRMSYVKKNKEITDYQEKNKNLKNADQDLIDPKNKTIVVKNGIMTTGILTPSIVSAGKANSIFHVVWNDFGTEPTRKLLDSLSRIAIAWMTFNGFSCGLKDVLADAITQENTLKIITDAQKKANALIEQVQTGKLVNDSGKTMSDFFEDKIRYILDKARDDAGSSAVSSISPKDDNKLVCMVMSGKGNNLNLAQIMATVGQQSVDNKRIQQGFGDRPLPHFTSYDVSPVTRGFIINSYITGLDPIEYFYHAMSGREGMIYVAIKTAESGYIQRQMVKCLEDCVVRYDATVRTHNNSIVQYLYGYDGYDPTHVESVEIDYMTATFDTFNANYLVDKTILSSLVVGERSQDMTKEFVAVDEEYRELLLEMKIMKYVLYKRDPTTQIYLPINMDRMIQNVILKQSRNVLSDLTPVYLVQKTHELLDELFGNTDKLQTPEDIYTTIDYVYNMYTSRAYIHSHLNVKKLIVKNKFTKEMFDTLLIMIKQKYQEALIPAGENVGTICAQSLGEPTTQMNLNVFHTAGISSKSAITGGVPRIKEITSCATKIKTPSITISLSPSIAGDREICVKLKGDFEHTYLKDIVVEDYVYYAPVDEQTGKVLLEQEDEQIMDEPIALDDYWVIRYTINKETFLTKNINMFIIQEALTKTGFTVVVSDDNAKSPIVVILLKCSEIGGKEDGDKNILQELTFYKDKLGNTSIKGEKSITSAYLREVNDIHTNPDGSVNKSGASKYVIDTLNNNLIQSSFMDIITNPVVDSENTTTNNINEVYENLGIEGARAVIITELISVYDESYINKHHFDLLADMMTSTGKVLSISRHVMNKEIVGQSIRSSGVLARASFEETTGHIVKAGVFGEFDTMNGTSANIMMGQPIKSGTNSFDVLFDEAEFMKQTKYEREKERINVVQNTEIRGTEQCTEDQFKFEFEMN